MYFTYSGKKKIIVFLKNTFNRFYNIVYFMFQIEVGLICIR